MLSQIGSGCESTVYSDPSINFVVKLRRTSHLHNVNQLSTLEYYKHIIHFHNVLFPETRYVYGGKHIGGQDILIQAKINGHGTYDYYETQSYLDARQKASELGVTICDLGSGNVVKNEDGVFFIDPCIAYTHDKNVPTCVLMDEILNDAWEYLVNYAGEVRIEA